MKFTTLIPLRYNDGREVPEETINRIIDDIAAQFDGCSDEGITKVNGLTPRIPDFIATRAVASRWCALTPNCVRLKRP